MGVIERVLLTERGTFIHQIELLTISLINMIELVYVRNSSTSVAFQLNLSRSRGLDQYDLVLPFRLILRRWLRLRKLRRERQIKQSVSCIGNLSTVSGSLLTAYE